MSLRSLRNLEYKPGNDTTPGFSQLPNTILEAFIPGYSFISKFLLDVVGIDVSLIVSVLLILFALTTGSQYLLKYVSTNFAHYFTTSVTIDAYDVIYENILEWAAEQEALRKVRALRVQSAGDAMSDDVDDLKAGQDLAEGAIFNFNNWAAKVPPRYEPHTGMHWFWHKGHYFKFERDSERIPGGWMNMVFQEQEKLTLSVLGRSTQPIKDLIIETRDKHLSHQTSKTTVRRPSPKEQRGRGRQAWTKVAIRPSRPMSTVVLDDTQKAKVLEDINEFLHPATPRWYANRGIPYRRGYLFYGPPGTGKTSLSFALAGVFGLDIYCLSLSEATLSEEDLILLFNSLPKRCIVLLEDIDSAGVLRKKTESDEETAKEKPRRRGGRGDKDKKDETKEDLTSEAASTIAKEVARAVRNAIDASEASRKGPSLNNQGVSMSGLLNAIDGVASQEGRVLVMTTNYPEKLDDALIRPGRVDVKIEFALATKQQIRELFVRMYCVDTMELARQPTKISQILPAATVRNGRIAIESHNKHDVNGHADKDTELSRATSHLLGIGHAKSSKSIPPTPPMTPIPNAQPSRPSSANELLSSLSLTSKTLATMPAEEIEKLATAFANALPEATFSPAEVQGFLLTRKKDPIRALLEVPLWKEEELKKKRAGLKVEYPSPDLTSTNSAVAKESEKDQHVNRNNSSRHRGKGEKGEKVEKDEKVNVTVETGSKSLLGTGQAATDDENDNDSSVPSSASTEASIDSVSSASSAGSAQSDSTVGD